MMARQLEGDRKKHNNILTLLLGTILMAFLSLVSWMSSWTGTYKIPPIWLGKKLKDYWKVVWEKDGGKIRTRSETSAQDFFCRKTANM